MIRNYGTTTIDFTYDESTGDLLVETPNDCIRMDLDEAVTLAERLQDWLLEVDG